MPPHTLTFLFQSGWTTSPPDFLHQRRFLLVVQVLPTPQLLGRCPWDHSFGPTPTQQRRAVISRHTQEDALTTSLSFYGDIVSSWYNICIEDFIYTMYWSANVVWIICTGAMGRRLAVVNCGLVPDPTIDIMALTCHTAHGHCWIAFKRKKAKVVQICTNGSSSHQSFVNVESYRPWTT